MAMKHIFRIFCGLAVASLSAAASSDYYGAKIGALSQLHHGVSGDVYAIDSRTIFLKDFNYDGEGPAAYFYVGTSRRPTNQGAFRLRDERGSAGVIRKYRKEDVTLMLPEGKTLRDIKWFSVWCDEFSVNFGDVTIPKNFEFPRPQKISALKGVHEVSSDNIVIVDAQTLLIPNFSYDGEAPDAKFWVGYGDRPTPQGIRIPDENGREKPLVRYENKTIVLTLPADLTVFDIGHFGVWCEAFTVDFGHVRIPQNINVPPSLRMLGISPQSRLNCEILDAELGYEVRWAVAGESIVVQLLARLEENEYMSFGISPNKAKTEMIGADVAVVWIDNKGKGNAQDYFLKDKSQCSGQDGSCPDTRLTPNSNSIRLLNAAMVHGYSIVTYQRPLKASDINDLAIGVTGSQAIVWAVGPLNQRQEVSYHSKFTKGDRLINFGRKPAWNCGDPESAMKMPLDEHDNSDTQQNNAPDSNRHNDRETDVTRRPEINRRGQQTALTNRNDEPPKKPQSGAIRAPATPRPAAKKGAWEIPPIQCNEPDDGVFYAQMGPTGGKHGYPAITGHVGWGISWYINGLLIPEINVVRGKTYTFVVESGNDPDIPAKYHPFYITDDPVGGYEHKTAEEREQVNIFAGVHRTRNGVITPIGTGRLCNWTPDPDGIPADEYPSFGAYQRSLTLKCDSGEPGYITWKPDEHTPDTVFYQCFTHRYLGWRINVLDSCDLGRDSDYDASDIEETYIPEASIRHETKILPNELFLLQHEKDLIKNHNMNELPPKIQFDLNKNSEISKIIAEGIKAAEELEESIAHGNSNKTYDDERIEFKIVSTNLHPQHVKQPNVPPQDHQQDEVSPLSEYLRPPGLQSGPVFRPVKVAGRRPTPMQVERRRPPSNQYRLVLPQPSIIVNHYKKPVSPLIRPFVKEQKPIKSIASFLLLGQQTELTPARKTYEQKQQNGTKPKKGPIRPPYRETIPTKTYHHVPADQVSAQSSHTIGIRKKPQVRQPYLPLKGTKGSFKAPYDVINHSNEASVQFNNGFHPDSVIVESGFKPIVRRRTDDEENSATDSNEENNNRRSDANFSDIDDSMEGDALFINQDMPNRSFEPMFFPSPPDSINSSNKKLSDKERLSGDLAEMEVEEGDDKMAMAGERVDAYYLPPDTHKSPPRASTYPEGSVVTYDGKAVLDTSLVNSLPPLPPGLSTQNSFANHHQQQYNVGHLSKTEQLIRNTPQFGPFKGEIPPIGQDFSPAEVVPRKKSNQTGTSPITDLKVLFSNSHQKPQQSPVTEYANPLTNNTNPISTKLTLLSPVAARSKRNDADDIAKKNGADDELMASLQ